MRIHPGRWFIEEEQPWTVHQAEGDVEPASLTAGERADSPLLERGEVEGLGEFPSPSKRVGAVHAVEWTLHDQLVHDSEAVPGAVTLPDVADP